MNGKRAGLVFLLAQLLGALSSEAQDQITVDASVVVIANARRQGINENYLMDSERERLTTPARTTAAALQEMAPSFMRYPGGEKSQSQFWSVPPWTNSQPTLVLTGPDYWPADSSEFCVRSDGTWIPNKLPLTFDEFMTNCQVVGAQANIPLCYSAAYDLLGFHDRAPTLQEEVTNAVEWVQYANITQGYDVKYWTLGNETDLQTNGNPGASQYAADLITFSQAMKAVDPTIKFCANGSSLGWWASVLTNAAAYVDCLDVHTYPVFQWTNGYDFFLDNVTTNLGLTADASLAISAITNYAPTNGIQIIVTEMSATDYGGGWADVNDLGHAIVAFEIMGENLLLPQAEMVEFWNTRWITNDLEAIPLGTNNLVVNPGFEAGLAGWNENSGGCSITTNSADVFDGGAALEVSGATNGGLGQDLTSEFVPNQVYTVSMWAQVEGDTTNYAGGGVTFRLRGATLDAPKFRFTNSAYSQYSAVFAAPPAFDYAEVWCDKAGDTNAILDVDDFSIVSGSGLLPANYDALSAQNAFNPTGQALSIWGQFLQQQMVSATSTPMVRAYASDTANSNTLSIFLENKDTNAHSAVVTLTNYSGSTGAGCQVFTGAGPADLHPTWTELVPVAVVSNTLSLTLAPVSITVLTLPGPPPPSLNVTSVGDQLVFTWDASWATLQEADAVTGPWADVAGNPGSPYTNAVTAAASQFFRLRQ